MEHESASSGSGFFSNPEEYITFLTTASVIMNAYMDHRTDEERQSLFLNKIIIWLFASVHSLTLPM